eukprot:1470731-Prymnesium_polylepis.1
MNNAHPVILLWVCTSLGIECSKLRYYVQNRNKVLQEMVYSTGRPKAFCKEQFLISTNEGKPIYASPFAFLNEYDLEMKSVHTALVNHSDYQWAHEHVSEKEENYNGSFVNLILCYWENILLEYAIQYFQNCGLDILVLMFDGLMVAQTNDDGHPQELSDKACATHCEILNEIGKHVLGIDMKWSTKPLHDKRVAVPNDFEPDSLMLLFEEVAPGFNERNKKIGENYVTINRNGSFSIRTKELFIKYHNHIGCMNWEKGKRERFVLKWLDDYDYPSGVLFDQAREYPPGGPPDRSFCPDDHFNLWEKFDFEKWDAHENPDGT